MFAGEIEAERQSEMGEGFEDRAEGYLATVQKRGEGEKWTIDESTEEDK